MRRGGGAASQVCGNIHTCSTKSLSVNKTNFQVRHNNSEWVPRLFNDAFEVKDICIGNYQESLYE